MTDLSLENVGTRARRLRVDTLVRLRWLAVAGQLVAILIVHYGLRFPLPIAASAHQQYLAAAAGGHGGEDDAAVVKVYERLADIEVKG